MVSSKDSSRHLEMSVDKLDVWNDPRIQRRSAFLNGKTYGERLKFPALEAAHDYYFISRASRII
jgi:hypothetical protein